MHSPKPYGLLVIGDDLTKNDESFIDSFVKSFNNLSEISNLEHQRRVKNLPDSGYVIVQNMGGLLKAITYKGSQNNIFENDGLAKIYVPMLYSGVITKAIVKTEDGKVGITLTETTRRRLTGYDPENIAPKEVELERFKIEYSHKFQYFKPKLTGIYTFTQYAKQRPTWYSGAMAELVQITGGYGRQDVNNLADHPFEKAQINIPSRVIEKIIEELDAVRLPGYTGIPNTEGQFQYDYKFSLSHAVSFDTDNKPWLVQIDGSGVYVMPLPIIPATTTVAFREYIEEVNDDEILKILDRFGGMPSGEAFPTGAAFQSWRRAGVIIKVCETSEFYSNRELYAACGWSFNRRGNEAFNTCVHDLPSFLKEVYSYKLKLNLSACNEQGRLRKINVSGVHASEISNYLSKLINLLPRNEDKTRAILYKLRRVPAEDIYQRALTSLYDPLGVTSNDVDYWDNLEINPIANHTGNLARVSSGYLYHPGINPTGMGALKFPELSGQGCESVPIIEPQYKGLAVKCDTIVFGCYVDDALKVIKYFYDERRFYKKEESTFENVMIVGSWDKTTTTGTTGLMGCFYTSDFDDRQESPEVTTYTKIVGKDLGYGNPVYSTPPILYMTGSLSRSRYYTHQTTTKSTRGFSLSNAVCVPVFNRDGFLYAYQESIGSETSSEKLERRAMADPTSYRLWCYDSIFHYIGSGGPYLGEPRSKDGTPVYVDRMNYNPTEYSDYADSGNWFNLPSGGFIDVTAICGPYTSRASGTHHAGGVSIGGESPKVDEYSWSKTIDGESSGNVSVCFSVVNAKKIHERIPERWYFDFSPQDGGGGSLVYFYRDACKVVFGDVEYANISETDLSGRRYKWGYSKLVNDKSAYHFIGVINE